MLISHQKITPCFWDVLTGIFESGNLDNLRKYVPNKNLAWVGSGRAGLRHILSTNNVKKVGVPSFTCHVVLEAVERARMEAIFIDSGAVADYNAIKEKINKIDALVLPYNFGFLPDVEKIVNLCRKNKVVLIEDCAQALGATYGSRLAGSFGDYAFYSFGISKNIGFCGGMIGSGEELENVKLPQYPFGKLIKTSLEASVSRLFFNRQFYPIFNKFLAKELRLKQEPLEYSASGFAKKVVLRQFKRYDKILDLRRKNAQLCMEELEGVVDFVKPAKNTNSAWLYFVLMSKNREGLIKALRKENVDITPLLTYYDLSKKGKLASAVEKQHACFALYRNRKEVSYIIKKIKKVCKNGDY